MAARKTAPSKPATGKTAASAAAPPPPVEARLRRCALRFLVHSFLYYRLGESVLSDEAFDRIADELRQLRAEQPQAELPYAEALEPALGPEGSGFLIRNYPPRIVTDAFKLLYATTQPEVDFREFVERHGYTVTLEPED